MTTPDRIFVWVTAISLLLSLTSGVFVRYWILKKYRKTQEDIRYAGIIKDSSFPAKIDKLGKKQLRLNSLADVTIAVFTVTSIIAIMSTLVWVAYRISYSVS